MIDTVRLGKYKHSIGIPASTEGYEDEAMSALVGLTMYGELPRADRIAWITAAQRAALKDNRLEDAALVLHKRFFYSQLLLAKGRAFGFAVNPDWASYNYAQCPWGLPDELFIPVYDDLKHGKGKAHVEPVTWGSLIDKAEDYAKDQSKLVKWYAGVTLLGGPALGFVKSKLKDQAKKFIAEYAPEFAERFAIGIYTTEFSIIGSLGVLAYDAEVPSFTVPFKTHFAVC